jgi:hypothetical protein
METNSNERLYMVFIHYSVKEGIDYEWIRQHKIVIKDKHLIDRLSNDICYLREVLSPQVDQNGIKWRGFAFIFLDPGWTSLLKIEKNWNLVRLILNLESIQKDIEDQLEESLQNSCRNTHTRERIITAGNLLDFLSMLASGTEGRFLLNESKYEELYKMLVGGAPNLKYDAPKVIEAAIRIANIGSGIPLFRFDDDVIFYGQRSNCTDDNVRSDIAKKTTESILRLCQRYQTVINNPRIRYFAFSGGYSTDFKKINTKCSDNENVLQLINGYSTRVLQLTEIPEKLDVNNKKQMETQGKISKTLVQAFLEDIVNFGANPFRQVISGAGLCLSDGAILDLPPYSNMQLNVMWIDDHLKFALHDELGHFGRWKRTHHHFPARVSEACFLQLRHDKINDSPYFFTYKMVKWHIEKYMLRLILGCIADSWLRKNTDIKVCTRPYNKSKYQSSIIDNVPHIYGKTYINVIPEGLDPNYNDDANINIFKQNLWQLGCDRVKELSICWGNDQYRSTFLGLFVHGPSHEKFNEYGDFFPKGMQEGLNKAFLDLPQEYQQAKSLFGIPDLENPSLLQAMVILVDDFVDYLNLVKFWPRLIQSIRYFNNKLAKTSENNLEWMFPILD